MATKKCTDGKDHNFRYNETKKVSSQNISGFYDKEILLYIYTKCGEVRVS